MRIIVSGGAGYLGSVLVPALISAGHRVDVMDIQKPVAGNWIERDILKNPVSVPDLEGVDAVIHLAALVGDVICHREPQRAVEVNYLATKYLARACRKTGIKLIFASTCSVYGVKNEVCYEHTDPEPFSVYGITKLKAESDVLEAGGIVFRMATIYGISPRMSYILVINELVRQAKIEKLINIYGGRQMRPFLEIQSAVRAFMAGLSSEISGEIINLADESITILELGKMVRDVFGCAINIIPEIVDKRSYSIDSTRAIGLLNFRPERLRQGIEAMRPLKV
jgi:nucleoside-diphosphate-sugar epimerase